MTGRAIFRSGSVKQNRFTVDVARDFVASRAAYVAMSSLQWKIGSLIVIKERGFPFRGVMAIGAGCLVAFRELPAVNVEVAQLAFGRRGFEVHVHERSFEVGRLVAIHARHGPM